MYTYTQEDRDMDAKVYVMIEEMIHKRSEEFLKAIRDRDICFSSGRGNPTGWSVTPECYLRLVARYDIIVEEKKNNVI